MTSGRAGAGGRRRPIVLSAIVAMDRAGLIGADGGLPWHLPADLKRFRRLTMGKPIVMGRRTFESLGRPLSGRTNIVVSRRPGYRAEGCLVADSAPEALKLAFDRAAADGSDEVVIIGGSGLYDATAALWDRLLLTVVAGDFTGDTHFSLGGGLVGRSRRLVEHEYHPATAHDPHPHWFLTLDLGPVASDPLRKPLNPVCLILAAGTDP